MSRGEFSKFIKTLNEEELREELTGLYGKIDEVKKHYAMELGKDADRAKIYAKAKKDIKNLLYIRERPRKRPRIAKLKDLLKQLNKFSVFKHEMADIYLYAAEVEMAYLLRRPSTTRATYNNCRENFEKACDIINQLVLHEDFKDRCRTMATDSDSVYMLEEEIHDIYSKNFRN